MSYADFPVWVPILGATLVWARQAWRAVGRLEAGWRHAEDEK